MKKALVIGILAFSSALTVSAGAQAQQRQQPPVQSVQSKPTIGQQSWAADGWLYQWTAKGWARTQTSRTFPIEGRTNVYDVFVNGRPTVRYDHSEKGWVKESYHHPNTGQIKYRINNPNARYYWVDHRSAGGPHGWITEAQMIAERDRLRSMVQSRQAQQSQQSQQSPGEIAPGVRESIPTDAAKMTPEEKRWVEKSNAAVVTNSLMRSQGHNCQMNRTPSPYDRSGNIQRGWHETTLGPRPNEC